MTKISKNTLKIATVILCIAMLVFGILIGRTRASLLEGNDTEIEMGMAALDVQLIEGATAGDAAVVADGESTGTLFNGLEDATIDPGYTYPEVIAARNPSATDEYVRVIVNKYWTDADEGKDISVDPSKIVLVTGDGWFENKSESSIEQSVYYCKKAVAAGTDSAPLFTGIKVDGSIIDDVSVSDPDENNVITATYAYDGLHFHVEAEVQAVQYSHAQDAAHSAWGVTNVTFADGTVSPAE